MPPHIPRLQFEYIAFLVQGDIIAELDKWGAEGWEVVALTEVKEDGGLGFIAKRPTGQMTKAEKGKGSIITLGMKHGKVN